MLTYAKKHHLSGDTNPSACTNRIASSLCIVLATCFWLFTQLFANKKNWDDAGREADENDREAARTPDLFNSTLLLKEAATVLASCFIIENLIHVSFPHCEKTYVLTHYFVGCIVQIAYFLIYFFAGDEVMIRTWRPIYFGYYMWTNILMMAKPHVFFPKFRLFYSIHHVVSFFITGTWALVQGDWELYVVRGVVIWLTSDIYVYSINTYRAINVQKVNKNVFQKLQLGAFCLERMHRIAAYVQAFIITKGSLSTIAWVIFGTGMFNDVLDASFQLRSILVKNFSEKNISNTSVGNKKDSRLSEVEEQATDFFPVSAHTPQTTRDGIH
jgi:hypothetical protein